ncbi:MAG: L17 family ribosomal protein, partial [Candidatus Eremiobacterota bacterium]
MKSRRLGRQTGHRLSMLRNLAISLLRHQRITTTETRAKELSQYVSRMITLARKAHQSREAKEPAEKQLAFKREVFRRLPGAPRRGVGRPDRDVAEALFNQLAPKM